MLPQASGYEAISNFDKKFCTSFHLANVCIYL